MASNKEKRFAEKQGDTGDAAALAPPLETPQFQGNVAAPNTKDVFQSSIQQRIAQTFNKPMSVKAPVVVAFAVDQLNDVFDDTREAILNSVDPFNAIGDAHGAPTADSYRAVMTYITQLRIRGVYARSVEQILPEGLETLPVTDLPAGLASLINGIGSLSVHGGAFEVIPNCDAAVRPTRQQLREVRNFHNMAINTGHVAETALSSEVQGTLWWILEPRAIMQEADVPVLVQPEWRAYWNMPACDRGPRPADIPAQAGTWVPGRDVPDRTSIWVHSQVPENDTAEAFKAAIVNGPGPGVLAPQFVDRPWCYEPVVNPWDYRESFLLCGSTHE